MDKRFFLRGMAVIALLAAGVVTPGPQDGIRAAETAVSTTQDGIIATKSAYPMAETVERITANVAAKGNLCQNVTVFAVGRGELEASSSQPPSNTSGRQCEQSAFEMTVQCHERSPGAPASLHASSTIFRSAATSNRRHSGMLTRTVAMLLVDGSPRRSCQ